MKLKVTMIFNDKYVSKEDLKKEIGKMLTGMLYPQKEIAKIMSLKKDKDGKQSSFEIEANNKIKTMTEALKKAKIKEVKTKKVKRSITVSDILK